MALEMVKLEAVTLEVVVILNLEAASDAVGSHISAAIGSSIKDARHRSILLVGFAGGFRRSELDGLDVEDLSFVRQGMIITLRHSKTDQEGARRKIGIPDGRTKHYPVRATENWMVSSGITLGPIYLSLGKGGQIKAVSGFSPNWTECMT